MLGGQFMRIEEIILRRRSLRRFKREPIDEALLKKIVECGAFYPSRKNKQPIKLLVINQPDTLDVIFNHILWGSKVPIFKEFADPQFAPVAYIIVLIDRDIADKGFEYEVGASIENMLLCATAYNIGSVWLKSINRMPISSYLELPSNVEIDSIVAMGHPAHTSVIIEHHENTSIITDKDLNLYIPKRSTDDIIFYNAYGHNRTT